MLSNMCYQNFNIARLRVIGIFKTFKGFEVFLNFFPCVYEDRGKENLMLRHFYVLSIDYARFTLTEREPIFHRILGKS